jgi:Arc/MetJ-type ribon-helix-helix transcriptional regulator
MKTSYSLSPLMPQFNISINPELSVIVDREMKRRRYANRSEFFRDLIRKSFVDEVEPLLPGDRDSALLKQAIKAGDEFIPLSAVMKK